MRSGEAEAAAGGEIVERQFALRLDQDRADPRAMRGIRPGAEQGPLVRRRDEQNAARVQPQLSETGPIRRAAGLEMAEPEQRPLSRDEAQRS